MKLKLLTPPLIALCVASHAHATTVPSSKLGPTASTTMELTYDMPVEAPTVLWTKGPAGTGKSGTVSALALLGTLSITSKTTGRMCVTSPAANDTNSDVTFKNENDGSTIDTQMKLPTSTSLFVMTTPDDHACPSVTAGVPLQITVIPHYESTTKPGKYTAPISVQQMIP